METYTDERDGETYKIVQIGNLYWFSENLRYQGVEHYFPNRNSDNVEEYGCLYTWENAIKACPNGWRLPTKEEFDKLLTHVTNNKSNCYISNFLALIAKSTSWTYYSNQGLDKFGFGALPAGDCCSDRYDHFGGYSYWWSATEFSRSHVYRLILGNGCACVLYSYKTTGLSVRCVKEV